MTKKELQQLLKSVPSVATILFDRQDIEVRIMVDQDGKWYLNFVPIKQQKNEK